MRRRSFLLGATASVLVSSALRAAVATVSYAISGLWVEGSPPFKRNPRDPHSPKGVLHFRLTGDKSDRTVTSYYNWDNSRQRQCPELIQRYARALGFKAFSAPISGDSGLNLPSLGNGDAVAANFASKSDRGFTYVTNGSADLPKVGSVISISGRSRYDNVLRIDGGHVSILCNYSQPSKTTTSFEVILFDQNIPQEYWKVIRFDKQSDKKWYGYFPNSGRDLPVIGWATPN